jgi:hypothetical protein
MSPIRYRDEDSDSSGLLYGLVGAALGVVAGLVIADRFGGFTGLTKRVRDRLGAVARELEDADSEAGFEELEPLSPEDAELEDRVLEAFRNDPTLSERAVDISALGDGVIELGGRVHSEQEISHAATIAGGVPGVNSVENRLKVRASRARPSRASTSERDREQSMRATRADAGVRVSRDATADRPAFEARGSD